MRLYVFEVLLIYSCFRISLQYFKFTKLTCEGLDKSMGSFEYCRMKAVNRNVNYIGLKANLKKPIKNLTLRYQFMKKANGWKPFLYDINIDICKFLERPNNPVIKLYFESVRTHSNLKSLKCPFKGTVILDNITNVECDNLLSKLQFQRDEYAEFTTWSVNNVPRARINSYFVIGTL